MSLLSVPHDVLASSTSAADSAGSTHADAEAAEKPPDADLRRRPEIVPTVSPDTVEEPPTKVYPPLAFPVIVLLAPAAVFGTLARLGLLALTTFNGESVFPLAYVQAVGCLIMGFGLRLKEPIGRFYAPLYTALTTGFCGSLTTFSSWQLGIFNAWINADGYPRGGLRNFVDGVGLLTMTLSLSLASLMFGSYLASGMLPYLPKPVRPPRFARYSLSVFATLLYGATFFTYFFLPRDFRHQATASLMFAFPGALTRYLLSVLLNKRFTFLPVGTLTANTLGTALLAAFRVIQSIPNNPISASSCSLLQGLADGYCGCLTTVSTFASEVFEIAGWKAARYVLISWLCGQGVILLIFGTSIWTGHAQEQITCTFG